MNTNFLEQLAFDAMRYEVETTPKPGLVDKLNSGCHSDMDIHLFYNSIDSLKGFYKECIDISNETLDDILNRFRKMGMKYLDRMLKATHNTNTHKGMIFSLGLVVCFTNYYLKHTDIDKINLEEYYIEILDNIKDKLNRPLINELINTKPSKKMTHGQMVYVKYNVGGIKEEVANGFKSIRLPLKKYIKEEYNEENNIKILFDLIKTVNDSTVLYREGLKGLIFMKSYSETVDVNDYDSLIKCDEEFTKRNISPGGCCDLLAIVIFFILVKDYLCKKIKTN